MVYMPERLVIYAASQVTSERRSSFAWTIRT